MYRKARVFSEMLVSGIRGNLLGFGFLNTILVGCWFLLHIDENVCTRKYSVRRSSNKLNAISILILSGELRLTLAKFSSTMQFSISALTICLDKILFCSFFVDDKK